jgi:hypothetical protein
MAVNGKAYRVSRSTGQKSEIFVDRPSPRPPSTPLQNAEITLFPKSAFMDEDSEASRTWREHTMPISDGTFRFGMVVAPGRYEAAIKAEKQGCDSVSERFDHSKREHQVTIFLACD